MLTYFYRPCIRMIVKCFFIILFMYLLYMLCNIHIIRVYILRIFSYCAFFSSNIDTTESYTNITTELNRILTFFLHAKRILKLIANVFYGEAKIYRVLYTPY